MTATRRARWVAASFALCAAFLWSTYYFFVLALSPGTAPSALVPYPFLAGGAAYLAWAIRQGHGRVVLELLADARAWFRIALLLVVQLSALAFTLLAGAVNASLAVLVGDVALTPLLVMWVYREGRERARSPYFVGGALLSGFGASLTIVAGGPAGPLKGLAFFVAPVVPVSIAVYFLLTAREGIRRPSTAVVGQSTFVAGLVGLPLAAMVPGGFSGLLVTSPTAILLVVGFGLTSFFAAPVFYFLAVERAGLVLPSVLQALIPVFTLGLSVILLAVLPSPLGLAGIPVAVAGGLLALQGTHVPWTPRYARPGVGAEGVPTSDARTETADGPTSGLRNP